jgi:hypothetical protein
MATLKTKGALIARFRRQGLDTFDEKASAGNER